MRYRAGWAVVLGLLAGFGELTAQDAPAPEQDAVESETLPHSLQVRRMAPAQPSIDRLSPEVLRNLLEDRDRTDAESPESADSGAMRLDLAQLRTETGPASKIQVFDGQGTQSAVDEQARSLNVKPGDLLAIQAAEPSPLVQQTDGVKTTASPTRLLLVQDDGRLRDLQMVHLSEGLSWRSESKRFEGEILIGILDRNDPGYSAPLNGRTIPVQLMAREGVLSEDSLAVKRIGQPYQKVDITVDFPPDPFIVRLISQLDEHLPHAELAVTRPELAIEGPDDLMGLGIGSGSVLVTGKSTLLQPGSQVALTLSQGWPDTLTLDVDASGVARGTIRSDWIGTGTLSLAPNGVYRAEPDTVIYLMPTRFLISSVLGAMLGALVFVYRRKRAGDRSRKVLLFDWLIGALVGAVVPILAFTGFKLPQWLPTPDALNGEAVPFAIAFIAAAAGTAMIDWFANRGSVASG